MPHVAAHEVVDPAGATLDEVADRYGPPPFRVPLIASPAIRVVLWGWPPGFVSVPHRHPRAEEMFHVLRGRAAFTFAGEPERTLGPGSLLVAPRGVAHQIRVVGDEPFVMLIAVAPNEDASDETIEPAELPRPG
jgi:quercetin dioxygenase-like cupin family protein